MALVVSINGKEEEVKDGIKVIQVLEQRDIRPEVVAVELNGKVVNRRDYRSTKLEDGDSLEFVYYMGGGKLMTSVSKVIGFTPLVKLNQVVENDMATVFAKIESSNPGGSVKDRICLSMIDDAEQKGLLKPGGVIVEPTSGNTGIGLAMIGAARGYKVILTMPETMSLERIYILKSYGAEIVLTPGVEGMAGSIKKAEAINAEKNAFMPQQFNNPANPEVHRRTTAPEIIEAVGQKIDAFIAGVGTGGTITGVGEVLKDKDSSVRIVAVEPAASAVLSGETSGPHKIQGIGAGFVPKVLNLSIIDQIVKVKDDEAFQTARKLAEQEGLFVGISAGAAAFASLKVAKELGKGKIVVTVFPDTGERYFSMEQFFRG